MAIREEPEVHTAFLFKCSGWSTECLLAAYEIVFRILKIMQSNFEVNQAAICSKFNAPFFPCDMSLMVGISRNVKDGKVPLNGMRVRPENGTCGWYIWAGEEFSSDGDFFVPLHASHLEEWAPLAIRFLGLPPGWRFLVTNDYEDVWEDKQLKI